jgi:hypothetical protein
MKPSRRMHEVYNPTYKLIVFCGSQGACLRYAQNRQGQGLEVRVAGR